MKKIMFIGAGPFQLRGIEVAKEMELYVIAIDRDRNAPGLKIVDMPIVLDIKDIEGAIKVAKSNKIDGVLTIATDIGALTAAAVAEELNLPGISRKAAKIATDKELQRILYKKYHIPSAVFRKATSLEEAISACKDIGFPVVIKPADSAGSKGVTKVGSLSHVENAYHTALQYSLSGRVLVEDYMEGVEASIEAFVYRGVPHILALSDKIRNNPPYLLDTTVIFPSHHPAETKKRIMAVVKSAIKAVGIENGPVHLEVMMTEEGPKMVELGARGPGFKVFTDILPWVTGIDVVKETIGVSLGEEPNLKVEQSRGAVLLFPQNTPGKVKVVRGLEDARKIKGVYEVEIYVKPGDIVKPLTCGADRIGHIISLGNTRESAIRSAKEVEKTIKIEVE